MLRALYDTVEGWLSCYMRHDTHMVHKYDSGACPFRMLEGNFVMSMLCAWELVVCGLHMFMNKCL